MKELIRIQKKKEKIPIRNDQLVFEDDAPEQGSTAPTQRFGIIRSLLMSPIGILAWLAVYMAFFGFLYYKVFKLGKSKDRKVKTE